NEDHATTHPFVVCDCSDIAAIRRVPGCDDPGITVVCINDFVYNPPLATALANGQLVAFVNIETCGDNPAEELVVNALGVGCDPHHEVITEPAVPGVTGDTITLADICSPSAGVGGSQVPDPVPSACGTLETNVRCQAIGTAGIQHYTCHTNPGHNALMHGLLLAQ
ncbi:MAG: hypothetical protein ACREQQ_13145, partial [Candidatus Binatia bacterium]